MPAAPALPIDDYPDIRSRPLLDRLLDDEEDDIRELIRVAGLGAWDRRQAWQNDE
ncbi:hypothetical protein [Aurantimonas coralicida]|uniref:hypothetical protein n=1 Tax=Aurantimonas coralicida TaxID=182270 RepID=UPI0023A35456|nr:hypothetical protein [Aurantimonas coralicida]MDE0924929.1 hypothetical protein [Aurantimonas coralicida]